MRRAPLLALFLLAAVPAAAQSSASDRDALLDSLRADVEAHAPDLGKAPLFSAAWMDGTGRGRASANVLDGTGWATDETLQHVLTWSLLTPYAPRERPPTAPTLDRRVDGPDSLLQRPVRFAMNQPQLTRETYGAFLREHLAVALGLDLRVEDRPTVVYALRARPGATLTPASDDTRFRTRAWDSTFEATASTSAALAASMSGALGHVVVDETGLEGVYDLHLAFAPDEVDFNPHTMPAQHIDAFRARLLAETGLELVPEVRPVEWLVVRARD